MTLKQSIAARARIARMTPEERAAHAQKARESWYKRSPEERAAHMARMTKLEGQKPRTERQKATIVAARAKIDLKGRSEWGKQAVKALNEKLTPQERYKKAKFANAMRKFRRKGYIVEPK